MTKISLEALGISSEDALALGRISKTLHRWFELEIGDANSNGSWWITRGHINGKPFLEHHHWHRTGLAINEYTTYTRIPDRETGAKKRLEKIMSRYPGLVAHVQNGSLYIIPKDNLE